jgi:hypothetical protein
MDAGFYRDKFIERWKPTVTLKPSEALGALGVKPEDVTDIVISHVHWDHLDGADLFPKARIWIQREEFEHYTNDTGAVLDRAIDADDAKMLAALKRAGRVQLIGGDSTEIMPGITVFTGGKHTFASEFATGNAASPADAREPSSSRAATRTSTRTSNIARCAVLDTTFESAGAARMAPGRGHRARARRRGLYALRSRERRRAHRMKVEFLLVP